MTEPLARKKPLPHRIYRKVGDTIDRLLPSGLRTPAHYFSRRMTHRLEAEYDAVMKMVRADGTAVDVGANIGIFTYGFLARGADVCAIEPQSGCARQIRAFYDLGFPRVPRPAKRGRLSLHIEAVSDTRGNAVLYVPLKNGKVDDESASLNPASGESIRVEVPVRLLDDYDLGNVEVLKIDVEGREVSVIQGAAATISRWRPALLVEVEQRHHTEPLSVVFDRIHDILGGGYETRFLDHNGSFRSFTEFDVERDQMSLSDNPLARRYVRNFFFIPK
ncbi:MAG TPA: FkbM family methyltransferase [Gemmatimonadaceae bacterium]|nr:FkbM family methyltransferase [Gemmatimonadaceae bacterium]